MNETCPNCGYCPHCKRTNQQYYPYYYQYYPYTITSVPLTGTVCGGSSGTATIMNDTSSGNPAKDIVENINNKLSCVFNKGCKHG